MKLWNKKMDVPELLCLVVDKLPNPVEKAKLRQVCHSWNSIITNSYFLWDYRTYYEWIQNYLFIKKYSPLAAHWLKKGTWTMNDYGNIDIFELDYIYLIFHNDIPFIHRLFIASGIISHEVYQEITKRSLFSKNNLKLIREGLFTFEQLQSLTNDQLDAMQDRGNIKDIRRCKNLEDLEALTNYYLIEECTPWVPSLIDNNFLN